MVIEKYISILWKINVIAVYSGLKSIGIIIFRTSDSDSYHLKW